MQKVNLYTDALKPKKVLLSLTHILLMTLLVGVLLAGVTWFKWEAGEKAQQVAEKKAFQANEMEASVELLRQKVKRIVRDEQLVATNKKLKRQLSQRQSLVQLLSSSISRGNSGFSDLLVALGKQRMASLWLTRIYFGDSGARVGLEGVSTKADDLPVYLKRLRNEPAFIGRNFDVFELNQKKGLMHFVLSSGEFPSDEERQ